MGGKSSAGSAAKRTMDIILSGAGLIVLSPLLLVAALIILRADGKPILFRQERVGLKERPFEIYKLRTMRAASEAQSTVSVADDPRILPGCAWLRRFKVDELPQLLNVLEGSMSLVGPRPTTANDVARMNLEQRRRHDAAPGITGLAQINGDTSISWPKRIAFDLAYIERQSLAFDLIIVAKTVRLLLADSFNAPPLDHDEWSG
jgi:lipopolysaccharide/colanic/teichoic acid biosynthesis glycosyltransferase